MSASELEQSSVRYTYRERIFHLDKVSSGLWTVYDEGRADLGKLVRVAPEGEEHEPVFGIIFPGPDRDRARRLRLARTRRRADQHVHRPVAVVGRRSGRGLRTCATTRAAGPRRPVPVRANAATIGGMKPKTTTSVLGWVAAVLLNVGALLFIVGLFIPHGDGPAVCSSPGSS